MLHSNSIVLLAALAGGVCAAGAAAQDDPVVRAAMKRVAPMPGPMDSAGGPDVIVGEIESSGCCPQGVTISASATSGSVVAYGLGTSSCNIASSTAGGLNLLWRSSTPFHPIIPQNMYRLKTVGGSTRFEQIGQSWSKYAFTALQNDVCGLGCNGPGGSVLGMGCSDPYSAGLNAQQGSLGPRYQCNPFTGVFPDQGSAWRTANWPAYGSSTIARRLQVQADDLAAAQNVGALYFGESIYISRDDACWGNSKNNASYRRFTVAANNTITLQGTVGGNGTQRTKPAIFAWRDNGGGIGVEDNSVMITEVTCGNTFFTQPAYPYSGPAGAGSTLVLPAGDGWLYVASRVTDLGGGVWHYEYAVENLNSDRGVGSFRIDFPVGSTITNAEMRKIDCHSGVAADDANRNAEWTQSEISASSDHIVWTTPHVFNPATPELGSYLRWGTLYNFRFDANVAPVEGHAAVGYFKPLEGYVDVINAAAHVPNMTPACYANCDGSTETPRLTAGDFVCFINAYALGQAYANCDGSTADPVLTGNDFTCFINSFGLGCS